MRSIASALMVSVAAALKVSVAALMVSASALMVSVAAADALFIANDAGVPHAPPEPAGVGVGAALQESDDADFIPYRKLTPKDFKAEKPPPELRDHGLSLGAAVCTSIIPADGMRFRAQAAWSGDEEPVYHAYVENLGFNAMLDRSCSWWNRGTTMSRAYILEHEQIHFAIFEVAARQLERRLHELGDELTAEGRTAREAVDKLERRIREDFDRTIRSAAERGAELDSETSATLAPGRQRRWLKQLEDELAEITAAARGESSTGVTDESGRPGERELLASSKAAGVDREAGSGRTTSDVMLRISQDPENEDTIEYRKLTREDFRAKQPPPKFAGHWRDLGAVTCASIVPSFGMRFRARAVWRQGDTPVYRAYIENIGFDAVMDRNCSWWGTGRRKPTNYVLEHEQVHFAIFEVAARRLTRRLIELDDELRASDNTAEDAIAKLEPIVQRELQSALEQAVERSGEFDQETSNAYEPTRQRRWLETVEKELAEFDDQSGLLSRWSENPGWRNRGPP